LGHTSILCRFPRDSPLISTLRTISAHHRRGRWPLSGQWGRHPAESRILTAACPLRPVGPEESCRRPGRRPRPQGVGERLEPPARARPPTAGCSGRAPALHRSALPSLPWCPIRTPAGEGVIGAPRTLTGTHRGQDVEHSIE
jgi:hypothetical protein